VLGLQPLRQIFHLGLSLTPRVVSVREKGNSQSIGGGQAKKENFHQKHPQ
jgi:hypothetical protein